MIGMIEPPTIRLGPSLSQVIGTLIPVRMFWTISYVHADGQRHGSVEYIFESIAFAEQTRAHWSSPSGQE